MRLCIYIYIHTHTHACFPHSQLKYRPTCPSCGKFVEKTSLVPNLALSAAVRVADSALSELDRRDTGPNVIERVMAAMRNGGGAGGESGAMDAAATEDPTMNIEQLSRLKKAVEEKIAALKVSGGGGGGGGGVLASLIPFAAFPFSPAEKHVGNASGLDSPVPQALPR